MNAIQTEKLTKIYGKVHALDGLDLQVEAGSIFGFLGPNGAGKTTTMRILTGLARPILRSAPRLQPKWSQCQTRAGLRWHRSACP